MREVVKETVEVLNIIKDIQERTKIIQDYSTNGFLDRNKAIDKIKELQNTDVDVTVATAAAQMMCGSLILERADDKTLIENLIFQINILEGKRIQKNIAMEETK